LISVPTASGSGKFAEITRVGCHGFKNCDAAVLLIDLFDMLEQILLHKYSKQYNFLFLRKFFALPNMQQLASILGAGLQCVNILRTFRNARPIIGVIIHNEWARDMALLHLKDEYDLKDSRTQGIQKLL
jgi:hypothetical protein